MDSGERQRPENAGHDEKTLHSPHQANNQAAPERWPSGRRRSPAKGVYVKSVSRVRIPSSPPSSNFLHHRNFCRDHVRPPHRPPTGQPASARFRQQLGGKKTNRFPLRVFDTYMTVAFAYSVCRKRGGGSSVFLKPENGFQERPPSVSP